MKTMKERMIDKIIEKANHNLSVKTFTLLKDMNIAQLTFLLEHN
jgi:hypothetical protein